MTIRSFVFLIILATAGLFCWSHQRAATQQRFLLAEENRQLLTQIGHRLEDKISSLTGGLIDIGEERRQKFAKWAKAVAESQAKANWIAVLMLVLICALVLVAILEPEWVNSRVLAGTSLICWLLGIGLPILSVSLGSEVEFLGQVVLREETKSLMTMLSSLATEGDWFLVGMIGLFGIAMPLAKTVCQLLPSDATQAHQLASRLSRWSLVDILVVGVFVAFLGGRSDGETQMEIGLGFWFFTGAALISLAIGRLSERYQRPHLRQPPESAFETSGFW